MANVRQRQFGAGEWDPRLWGRDDLEAYGAGSRVIENMFPTHHGNLLSIPGTYYVNNTKNDAAVRLIPFNYADISGQNYVLEFGDLYIRFHTSSGTVASGGVPYEVVTPYASADLARLKFCQIGDTITIVHPNYAPRELRRVAHTNWTLTSISFTEDTDKWVPTIFEPLPTPVAPQIEKRWEYATTALLRDPATGRTWETAPEYCTETFTKVGVTPGVDWGGTLATISAWDNLVAVYSDLPVNLWHGMCSTGSPLYIDLGYETLAINFYRGRDGVFGWIGQSKPLNSNGECWFLDQGQEPDYARAPPDGRNPFRIYPDTEVETFAYPSSVAVFEQRRIFGGSSYEPAKIWGSVTDQFARFDLTKAVVSATDSVEFELAARRREQIRSMVPLRHLLVLTNSGEWVVGGAANGDPMSPFSIRARCHSERGSSWLDPIVVGDVLIHIQPKGTVVRDLFFDVNIDSYTGSDLSMYSRHLLRGKDIVSWAWAEDPYSVIWAARDDGALLSLTYVREQKLFAWAQHDLAGGAVEQVCSIPEGKEDSVYLVVRRTVNGATVRFLERMSTREFETVQDSMCVDAGILYTGGTTTVSGLSHLEGETVSAVIDGNVVEGLVVSGGAVAIPFEGNKVFVGLPYTCSWEALDVPGARERQKICKEVLIEIVGSRGIWVGETLEDMDSWHEWPQRTPVDVWGAIPLMTGTARITVSGKWGTGGRVAVQQRAPLPLSIAAVQRELAGGGS